jgi:hypothetical protein
MRRVVWAVLTGLGVFFIVLALMFLFYVPGQAIKAPLNEYTTSTVQGTNMSYFSATQLQELTGVTMRATNTVAGDVVAAKTAGASQIAVWKSFTALEDLTNHQPFQYSSEQLAFDRTTGVLVNCCGNFIGSDHQLHLSGQGYLWPFNAQKKSYEVFDTTVLKPVLFRYEGTATTDGVSTYRFVTQIPNQQIGTQTIPASLVGMSGNEVTLPEFYTAAKTYYVDPVTGAPLQVNESQRITLQDSTGATRLVLLAGDLASTPASVRSSTASDQRYMNEINLLKVIGPIVGIVLGIILLVIGLVLGRSRTQDGSAEYEEEPVESPA